MFGFFYNISGKIIGVFCVLILISLHLSLAGAQQAADKDEEELQANQAKAVAHERPSKWGEPTEVRVMIIALDVDAVESANLNFSASIYYEAQWKDPSLAHDGAGPKVLPVTAVWTPRLTIVNQQQTWNAYPNLVEVQPDGLVTQRQKVWGWFSQTLDLTDFPFDRQKLQIHLAAAGLTQSELTMTPLLREHGRMSMIREPFSLPDFSVRSWNAEPRGFFLVANTPPVAGYIMEIDVQRNPTYYIWKLILPLCLIVAMSWVPRWIPVAEVGTNVGLAATSLLTLVAYLFATALLLPRASYLTRMDLFILSSNIMVFVGLLQTVLTSYYVKTKKVVSKNILRIHNASKIAYPVALIGIIYFSFFMKL